MQAINVMIMKMISFCVYFFKNTFLKCRLDFDKHKIVKCKCDTEMKDK